MATTRPKQATAAHTKAARPTRGARERPATPAELPRAAETAARRVGMLSRLAVPLLVQSLAPSGGLATAEADPAQAAMLDMLIQAIATPALASLAEVPPLALLRSINSLTNILQMLPDSDYSDEQFTDAAIAAIAAIAPSPVEVSAPAARALPADR